ncbi:MAG TPA: hypothetical protein VM597_33365 [Gemmataceae bacterium]|nr:hypothetical protein [Gemmataceae bacterium]
MARAKTQKTKIVAFKVEEDLAEFLGKLKNKSEFIRKAILAQFSMECPLCTGSGVVPRGLHDHYKPVILKENKHPCSRCKTPITLPLKIEAAPEADRKRLEQFFDGGPLFCPKCFPEVPSCDDCEWHIPHENFADHFKKVHAN